MHSEMAPTTETTRVAELRDVLLELARRVVDRPCWCEAGPKIVHVGVLGRRRCTREIIHDARCLRIRRLIDG